MPLVGVSWPNPCHLQGNEAAGSAQAGNVQQQQQLQGKENASQGEGTGANEEGGVLGELCPDVQGGLEEPMMDRDGMDVDEGQGHQDAVHCAHCGDAIHIVLHCCGIQVEEGQVQTVGCRNTAL